MQTSVSFILESTMSNFDVDVYLATSKGYERSRLPQIDPDTFDRVLLHLARVHDVKHFKVKPGKLKPCQNEINIEKVQNMIKEGRDFSNAKFICSKDWEIVDGHHTHVGAIHTLSEEDRVDAYRTNLPINKLIEVLNKLKVTTRQMVNESASNISDWSEDNANDLAFEVGYKGKAIAKTWYTDGGDIDWTAVIHDKPWPMYDGNKDNTKAFVMSSDGHAIASTNVKNTSDANLKSVIDNFVKTSKLSVLYDAGFTDVD